MKTIKFNCRGNNAPAYGCNKPGDNSGEYVSADVAEKIYEALEGMLNDGLWVGGEWVASDDARNKAHDALEKARGES